MAKAVGYAPFTIHQIWRAFGLQPHRTETFKLSNDPMAAELLHLISCELPMLRRKIGASLEAARL